MKQSTETTFYNLKQYDENKCVNDNGYKTLCPDPLETSPLKAKYANNKTYSDQQELQEEPQQEAVNQERKRHPRGFQVTSQDGRRGYTRCPRCLGENVYPTEAQTL